MHIPHSATHKLYILIATIIHIIYDIVSECQDQDQGSDAQDQDQDSEPTDQDMSK